MTSQLLHPKVDPTIQARKILTDWYYKKYPSDDCFVPHLEHWLAVLGSKRHPHKRIVSFNRDICSVDGIDFNLITGQPNSPEDYKTFNDIVGV